MIRRPPISKRPYTLLPYTSLFRSLRIRGIGPDRKALLSIAERLGIADRVEVSGFVADMAPHYSEATVMALSSRWEDLPATLIEAMACGCPVVSTADRKSTRLNSSH